MELSRVEHQIRKSECSFWKTQQECVESERHLGGNQNQGIPSYRSYHPPLWLRKVDNLSTAYKEVSHDLSEEDSRHHMAKTHPRYRSFNSGFSSQHLHNLDAITASLGRSCNPHERIPTHEEIVLLWTISGQALSRRPEKRFKDTGLHEIFRYLPSLSRISGPGQRQVAWSYQTWSESLWNQKKSSSWAAQKT